MDNVGLNVHNVVGLSLKDNEADGVTWKTITIAQKNGRTTQVVIFKEKEYTEQISNEIPKLKAGEYDVTFRSDGNIDVGCQVVTREEIEAIHKKLQGDSNEKV